MNLASTRVERTTTSTPLSETRMRSARLRKAPWNVERWRYLHQAREMRCLCRHAVRWLHRAAGVEPGFVASPAHIARRVFAYREPSVMMHPERTGMVAGITRMPWGWTFYYDALTPEEIGWACAALAWSAMRDKFFTRLRRFMSEPGDHHRIVRAAELMIAAELVRVWNAAEVPS